MNKISAQGDKWAPDLGKNKNVKLVESCYRGGGHFLQHLES